MKNFDVLGVRWKIQLLREGGVYKKRYRGGNCLKRGAWTVYWFKEGLGRNTGMMFLRGGWYPDTHYGHGHVGYVSHIAQFEYIKIKTSF